MNVFKRYYLIRLLVTVLFGTAFGVFFLVMSPYAAEFFDILVIAMGLLTAVLNLPGVCFGIVRIREKGAWVNLLLSVGAVTLGILLMFLHRTVLLVLLGIYSVCFPLLRVFLVRERKKQFVRELPVIFSGLAMILIFLTRSEHIIMRVLAICCFIVTALYLIYGFLVLHFRFGPPSKEKTDTSAGFDAPGVSGSEKIIEAEFEEKE